MTASSVSALGRVCLLATSGSFLGLDPTSAEYAPALSAQLVERFLDERY
jgi:hypothetical protein